MLIDWFTVCAQLLNFLVLVWLMKRFLYKPILAAIDSREKHVSAEIKGADARKADAEEEHAEFLQKNEQFDQERAELLSKAVAEVKIQRQTLMEDAQKDSEELRTKRMKLLQDEIEGMEDTLVLKTKQEVFAIARKALSDLATATLEERIADVFIRRLRELSGPSKDSLRTGLTSGGSPIIMRCAFELLEQQRKVIQTAVNETFSAEIPLQFEVSPPMIGGIELVANGQKVSWNITEYLDALESSAEAYQAKVHAAGKA